MGIESSSLRQALWPFFGILFVFFSILSVLFINYYYRYRAYALKSASPPPVLTPMSGSRGVVTLLAHISPACSTQPSISNVPPAQAGTNFGHYKYTQPPPNHRVSQTSKWQRIRDTVMVLMVPFWKIYQLVPVCLGSLVTSGEEKLCTELGGIPSPGLCCVQWPPHSPSLRLDTEPWDNTTFAHCSFVPGFCSSLTATPHQSPRLFLAAAALQWK